MYCDHFIINITSFSICVALVVCLDTSFWILLENFYLPDEIRSNGLPTLLLKSFFLSGTGRSTYRGM